MATATRVRTSHDNCDHPKTKAARAACRRARASIWAIVERGDVEKGATVRVHTADDMLEGTLLGWGAKRIVVRVDDTRANVNAADIEKIEAHKDDVIVIENGDEEDED